MPGELLRVGAPDSSARTRQSSLVFVSAVVHAGIVAVLVVASMLVPGVLPTPHASVLWDGSRLVRLADITLPPPAPSARPRAQTPAVPTATVPLTAPDGIAPEPEREPPPSPSELNNDSVVQGIGIGDLGGTIVAPPPAPRSEPTRPVRLHSGIEPPRKVRDIVPVYPALARSAGVQGIVILEATIDERGDVVAAHVIRSIPMLDDAAVEAVRQWKYTPARLNDQPVPVVVTVTVNFTLAAR